MSEKINHIIQALIIVLLIWVGSTLYTTSTTMITLVDRMERAELAISDNSENISELTEESVRHLAQPHDQVSQLVELAKATLRLEMREGLNELRKDLQD